MFLPPAPNDGRRSEVRRRAPWTVEALEPRVLLSKAGAHETAKLGAVDAPAAEVAPAEKAETPASWTVARVSIKGQPVSTDGLKVEAEPARPPTGPGPVQKLPDIPTAQVVGGLAAGDRVQVFRVPVRPETQSIRVDVQVPEAASGWGKLWLMDEAGRVVGSWDLPGPGGSLSVELNPSGRGASGSTLLVGISRGDSGSDPTGPFLLQIGRQDAAIEDVPESPQGSPLLSLPLTVPGTDTLAASPAQVEGLGNDPGTAGPLPTRSAGPAAGVLADGHPTFAVGRNDAAILDLALLGLSAEAPEADRPAAPEGLVQLRSPDGVPLLGAATPPRLPIAIRADPPRAPSPPRPATPAPDRLPDGPRRIAQRPAKRPASVEIGLIATAGLAFGFLLPDLVAAFTPAPPRRPSPRVRRLVIDPGTEDEGPESARQAP